MLLPLPSDHPRPRHQYLLQGTPQQLLLNLNACSQVFLVTRILFENASSILWHNANTPHSLSQTVYWFPFAHRKRLNVFKTAYDVLPLSLISKVLRPHVSSTLSHQVFINSSSTKFILFLTMLFHLLKMLSLSPFLYFSQPFAILAFLFFIFQSECHCLGCLLYASVKFFHGALYHFLIALTTLSSV